MKHPMIYTVTKRHSFCYGHRLLNYTGPCHNLHGHSGHADITLAVDQLDERGLSVDFFDIKKAVGTWIDAEFDHKMLLEKGDPVADLLKGEGHVIRELDCAPTAENIARLIFDYAASRGLPVVSVTMWESERSSATYQPKSRA